MQFIPWNQLTPEQQQAVERKWPRREGTPANDVLEAHEFNFHSDDVTPFVRRHLPQFLEPAQTPAAPAPKAGATGFACPKCGKVFATGRKLGGHARHCTSGDTGEAAAPISAAPISAPEAVANGIVKLPLACLEESSTNPRTSHDQAKHEELCASMRAHGWVEAWPAMVRPKVGPGFIAVPTDPGDPEAARWSLVHPDTRVSPLAKTDFTREEAEALAAGKFARRYEIVFAHRRKRAALAVGLEEAPAVVRDLADVEVLELQLIENVQRADLSPVEEAEHLRRLLALRNERGEPVHTKKTLSAKIGKTEEHVRQAVSLCRLEGAEREAVAGGKLGVAIGYALAVIPDAEVRASAAREILNPSEGEGPMRKKAALDFIRRTCTRNLREAKFPTDDAELVPARFKIDETAPDGTARFFGGSCLDCPFNSVNVGGERSPHAPKLGVCGNVACFDAKVAADFDRWRAAHNQPDAGKVALTSERNAEIFDNAGEIDWRAGLVPLNQAPDAGLLKEPGESRTWKELTKGKLGEVLVARDPRTGKKVEVVDLEKAKAAAELNEHRIFKTSKAARQNDAEHKAATLETKRQQTIVARVEERLLGNTAAKAEALEHLPAGGWRFLAEWVCGTAAPAAVRKVEARRKLEAGSLGDALATYAEPQALGLVVELVLADYYAASCDDGASQGLDLYGISLEETAKAVAAAVDAELAPPAPATPRDPALPHGDGWRALKFTRENLAAAFTFNEHGVCTAPDVLEVTLPTSKKQPLVVRLEAACEPLGANVAGLEWHPGFEIDGKGFRSASPCSNAQPGHLARFGAFAAAARKVAERLDAEERVSAKVREAMHAVAAIMHDLEGGEECGLAEQAAGGEPEAAPAPISAEAAPAETGDPEPTHVAYLTTHAIKLGRREPVIKAFTPDEWREALGSPSVVWLLVIGGVASYDGAVAAANEALAHGEGTITEAGRREGFTLEPATAEAAA